MNVEKENQDPPQNDISNEDIKKMKENLLATI